MNPYKTLGVHKRSTDEDIAKAYKTLAQLAHPDRGGSAEKFAYINECYQAIKDKKARRRFEESLYMEDKCFKCQGRGVHWESKGFSEKVYHACDVCHGSGWSSLIDDEPTNEKESSDVIEL